MCYTLSRIAVLLCAAIALAFAVLGVYLPLFEMPSRIAHAIQSLNASIQRTDFNISTEKATLERFGQLVSGAPAKSKMTLWRLSYGTSRANTSINLRGDYFTCYQGNIFIQAAEGFAVVTCVLGAANLIMSVFLFFFAPVVKFPLAVYLFLAAAAAVVTVGFALNLYLQGWCSAESLKASEWSLSLGFASFAISCGVSLTASVLVILSY
ncbi:conserved hypothetical protein [Leishmania braziliensis MHOM/BR/75/M2904]|uniref:Amastin-like surface protein-like protein n=2 Tax=Leishmania braziliensis TaxID=5660 RepID=A4HFI0_LEIBR|nr:conserved hypothetical protein [Leishmania braziliensis MHOM/BR/75/M2904]KAI5684610.1 Amastin surface glycoprotein [Leishmania braziliensis]CAJ2475122.1 unnamed protein product [Leishmania braziliensis]CAJ2475624.1 unnamed protein product [Leishmania braziliensis]CAM45342.1 conserved hypothetical protein [Leishmania braziliensis MHOM/BR/75/M2904]SYZ66986.1 Amastin_surface_glycoprotein [Leishmania braziliensis MHOM/BR/75/M2904]